MILVTGASGLLGAALTRRLVDAGLPVAAMVMPSDPARRLAALGGRIARRAADLADPASLDPALHGIDTVFHAAAIVPIANALTPRMEVVNVAGTAALLAAAERAGVRRIVHVSTISAIGLPMPGGIMDEDCAPPPADTGLGYVDTKRRAEAAAIAAAARGQDVVVVNPAAIVTGDGTDPFGWAYLIRLVARRRLRFVLPGGISLLSERDAVEGLVRAWRHGASGRRYILTSVNTSYRALFAEIARQAGIAEPRWTAPPLALRLAGWLNSARNRLAGDPLAAGPLNRESAGLLAQQLFYSAARAQRELGFRPQALPDLVRDALGRLAP